MSSLPTTLFAAMLAQRQRNDQELMARKQLKQQQDRQQYMDLSNLLQGVTASREKAFNQELAVAKLKGENAAQLGEQKPQEYENSRINDVQGAGYDSARAAFEMLNRQHQFKLDEIKSKEQSPEQKMLAAQAEALGKLLGQGEGYKRVGDTLSNQKGAEAGSQMVAQEAGKLPWRREDAGNELQRIDRRGQFSVKAAEARGSNTVNQADRRDTIKYSQELAKAGIPQIESVLGQMKTIIDRNPKYNKLPPTGQAQELFAKMPVLGRFYQAYESGDDAAFRQVRDLFNMIVRNKFYGVAVSPKEESSFNDVAENGIKASPENVAQALNSFAQIYSEMRRSISAGFAPEVIKNYNQNYQNMGANTSQAPAQPAKPAMNMDQKIDLFMQKNGITDRNKATRIVEELRQKKVIQ